MTTGKTYTLNDDLQWVFVDYVPEDIDDPTAHGKYIAQLNDIVHTQVERIRQLEDECQKLANYLMHELVFVHERLIEEVDIALIPYLGNSTPLE
jgi:phytoene dehydrogenase-like protein